MGSRSTTRCSPSSCTTRAGTPVLVIARALGWAGGGDVIGHLSSCQRNGVKPELGPRIACRRCLFPVERFPVRVRFDPDRPRQLRLPTVLDPRACESLLEALDPLQAGVPVMGRCRRRCVPGGSTFGKVALHTVSVRAARCRVLSNTAHCRAAEPLDMCPLITRGRPF
jgi:hypothetical protein